MGFYKNCENISFFLSCHLIFIGQLFLVYFIDDNSEEEYNLTLLIHKILFCIILSLTVFSHLQIAVTDPGTLNSDNNINLIEFYFFIYRNISSITNNPHKKISKSRTNNENDEDYNPYSDRDDYPFPQVTSIDNKLKKQISNTFNMKTSRCLNCFVIRPKSAHHCNVCHGCILDHDHHCPWINNCLGLFNKKYFILFNLYAFISVIYTCGLYVYYTMYKNYKDYRNNIVLNLLTILIGIFSFVYGLFVAIMIWEQHDNVTKEFRRYRDNKELYKKLTGEKMRIIFSGPFSFKWFLPFYEGGRRNVYFALMKKKYDIIKKAREENKENIEEDKKEN